MVQLMGATRQSGPVPDVTSATASDLHLDDMPETLAALCTLAGASAAAVIAIDHDGARVLASNPALADTLALKSMVERRAGREPNALLAISKCAVSVPVSTAGETTLWVAMQLLPDERNSAARIETIEAATRVIMSAQIDAAMQAHEAQRHAAALAATLDQGECGILIVHHDRSVLYANHAAREILAARDGLELRRNVPRPIDYHDAIRFREALDCVVSPPPSRMRTQDQGMVMLLARLGDERPLIAVVAPAHASPHAPEGLAAAVIYVTRPERSVARGLDSICQLHGLSPVETLLVGHLMTGLTVSEAAAEMRVKPDTARAYLKQVFAKTGTHRQSELLQLFIRYQHAVRGDYVFKAA